jgi:hypothetical protein
VVPASLEFCVNQDSSGSGIFLLTSDAAQRVGSAARYDAWLSAQALCWAAATFLFGNPAEFT